MLSMHDLHKCPAKVFDGSCTLPFLNLGAESGQYSGRGQLEKFHGWFLIRCSYSIDILCIG